MISFVIPCYRSENTIGKVVDDIFATYGAQEFEVILVNDCSPDNTLAVLREICGRYANVRMLSFAKNFGQHSALMAGLRESTGDIVICLDDDGQTPPAESVKLVEKINEGFDVVYARYEEKQHSVFRNWGSRLNNRMSEIMLGKPKDLYMSSFVAMQRFVVDEILKYDNPYPYLGGLVLRTTSSITDVPVVHKKRAEGASGYSLSKLINLWMNGFTSFSIKPLRVATVLGLVFALAGFIAGIVLVIEKLVYGDKIQLGWTSNMAVILFIGGLILLVLGLVGEYMGRTFISMNKQPQYVIKEKANTKKDK
jgi:glycosyltransferase involved in cell wall biosynthesis